MKKYQVTVPLPTAKRMVGSGKIIIEKHQWYGSNIDVTAFPDIEKHVLGNNNVFEFSLPDDYEWQGTTTIIDGSDFRIYVEYSNTTGTRKERYELTPTKV